MQRFFLELSDKKENEIILHDKNIIHQIEHVLRYKTWDKIICLFNDNNEYLVELINFSKNKIKWKVIKKTPNNNETFCNLVLFLVLPKSKTTWELIVQKSVELWAQLIVPIKSSRSYAKYNPVNDRVNKIIKENYYKFEKQ